MVKASQREPGTLACGVFKGQGVWLVVEAYRDAQAMDAHLGSAALQAFLAKVPVLLRSEPRVRKLEALEAFGSGEAR